MWGNMRKPKQAGWPKAHEVHSSENRIGQAWTQNKVMVFDNNEGTVKKKPLGHFACPKCDFVVEIDSRTYAFCPKCGDIFNDSPLEISIKARKEERGNFRVACHR